MTGLIAIFTPDFVHFFQSNPRTALLYFRNDGFYLMLYADKKKEATPL